MKSAGKYYTVSLPCKRHIEKFVRAIFGDEAIRADHSSTLGCFVLVSLEKEIYDSRNVTEDFQYKGMEGSVPIQVSQYVWQTIGFEIAPEKQLIINRFLENYFKESLYLYCAARAKEEGRFKGYDKLIYEFAKKFNLVLDAGVGEVEDISYEGLKKMEYRYRTKRMEESVAVSIPQLFP